VYIAKNTENSNNGENVGRKINKTHHCSRRALPRLRSSQRHAYHLILIITKTYSIELYFYHSLLHINFKLA